MRLIADTGGIVAAMNTAEPDNHRFLAALESASLAIITPLVIAEVHYLLSSTCQHDAARDFLRDLADGFYEIAHPAPADFRVASTLIARYEGRMQRKRRKPGSLDLADAMNIVAAKRYSTNLILATDQDYRITKPLTAHQYFVIIPYDEAGQA